MKKKIFESAERLRQTLVCQGRREKEILKNFHLNSGKNKNYDHTKA
jgi:hypothetical protein